MFLPDGRVLIMDNELYKRTIEQSIVLDLLGSEPPTDQLDQLSVNPSMCLETSEEDKNQSSSVSRFQKDNNRKQSQANQKRRAQNEGDMQVDTNTIVSPSQQLQQTPQSEDFNRTTQTFSINSPARAHKDFLAILN